MITIDTYTDLSSSTFLIVDAVGEMRVTFSTVLGQMGFDRILTAASGSDALKILRRQPINMVLSHWDMPMMSGLDLLNEIRSDQAGQLYTLPFILYTAEGSRERVQQAIDAGVSGILITPFRASALLEHIKRAILWTPNRSLKIASPSKTIERDAPIKSADMEQLTVLIVDDSPVNIKILSEILKNEYNILVAENGPKALEICRSDSPPDLVLLDVMMPGMSGFDVARKLRRHPNTETIPVIFVTTLTGSDAVIKGLQLGAIDFVTKPINVDIVRYRVRNFMRYVQLRKQLQISYDFMLEAARTIEKQPALHSNDLFESGKIQIMENIPGERIIWVRGWSLAGDADGGLIVGAKLGKLNDGRFIIADIQRVRADSDQQNAVIVNTAGMDGKNTKVSLPQCPGRQSKLQIHHIARSLAGYRVICTPDANDKLDKARLFVAQVNTGNVCMLQGDWNKSLSDELRAFPNGIRNYQIDALSMAFGELINQRPMQIKT